MLVTAVMAALAAVQDAIQLVVLLGLAELEPLDKATMAVTALPILAINQVAAVVEPLALGQMLLEDRLVAMEEMVFLHQFLELV